MTPTAPPGFDNVITILSWVAWLAIIVCVAGFLASAGMLGFSYVKGDPPARAVTGCIAAIIGTIVIGSAAAIFLAVSGVNVLG